MVSIKLLWNRTSTWVFSCNFDAYFQNTFLYENLWRAASVNASTLIIYKTEKIDETEKKIKLGFKFDEFSCQCT